MIEVKQLGQNNRKDWVARQLVVRVAQPQEVNAKQIAISSCPFGTGTTSCPGYPSTIKLKQRSQKSE